MFERFTERARRVISLAQEESGRLRHDYVGTEHLLVGLIREGEGVAAQALTAAGVTVEGAREQVEAVVGYGEADTSQKPFTSESKRVLESSLKETFGLGHNYIGTEHLLLGLAREGEGVAARVLRNLNVNPEALRREVMRRLASETPGFVPPGGARIEEEAHSRRMLFRGRVGGIRAEVLSPDEGNLGRRVPVVVGLDYSYDVTREGSDGFEALNHAGLSDLVERFLGDRGTSLLEAVVGQTGDLLLEEVPSIQEVTVSVTRDDPAPGVTVSATFRR